MKNTSKGGKFWLVRQVKGWEEGGRLPHSRASGKTCSNQDPLNFYEIWPLSFLIYNYNVGTPLSIQRPPSLQTYISFFLI